MCEIIIVIKNVGKVKDFEIFFLLKGFKVKLFFDFFEIEDVEEMGVIFVENVMLKVEVILFVLNKLVIVDDLGFVIDVLNGELGVYFVCYVGENKDDNVNIEKVF